MANFCCDCTHWEKVTPIAGDAFGMCHSVEVGMKVALDGKTKLGEDGTLWTSAYFGCVHWRKIISLIVDFKDIIDDKTGKPK